MPHFMWLLVKAERCHQDIESAYGTQRAVVPTPERQSSLVLRSENKERAGFCVLMKGLQ